jgi:hypothetical protein
MLEKGQIIAGPGAVWRATSSEDCHLGDYKVIITDDKRVFVRGELRGELTEIRPAGVVFTVAKHNDRLEVCCAPCVVIWEKVTQ